MSANTNNTFIFSESQIKPGIITTASLAAAAAVTGAQLAANTVQLSNLARVGSANQVLTSQGAGADPQYTTVASGEWTLDQTLTPAGVATISTSALGTYKAYKIVILNVTGTGTKDQLGLRFNADTGANYQYKYITGTTITLVSGATIVIFADITNGLLTYAEAIAAGKTGGSASAYLGVSALVSGYAEGGIGTPFVYFGGDWTAAINTQVTSITVLSQGGQVFTGTIYIYGRN